MKASLVIDMPESCMKCKLKRMNLIGDCTYKCIITEKEIERPNSRQEWCPLKETLCAGGSR